MDKFRSGLVSVRALLWILGGLLVISLLLMTGGRFERLIEELSDLA